MTQARGRGGSHQPVTAGGREERGRAGDRGVAAPAAAFEAVFTRHYAAVHRYAQQRVGVDAADEIAAETFLQAFDNRRRFDAAQPSARPWLLGIATNLMRRRWRDERRQLAAYARTLDQAAGRERRRPPPVPGLRSAAISPRRSRRSQETTGTRFCCSCGRI